MKSMTKQKLADKAGVSLNTSINITCYDRDGKIIKRVTSTDQAPSIP